MYVIPFVESNHHKKSFVGYNTIQHKPIATFIPPNGWMDGWVVSVDSTSPLARVKEEGHLQNMAYSVLDHEGGNKGLFLRRMGPIMRA